jgi:hypothetical protein
VLQGILGTMIHADKTKSGRVVYDGCHQFAELFFIINYGHRYHEITVPLSWPGCRGEEGLRD